MATPVKAKPTVTLTTSLSALSGLTGADVAIASSKGMDTIKDVYDKMVSSQCRRKLADGSEVIDLALLGIDQDTSDRIESAVLSSGVSRPKALVNLIGDATGADPVVVTEEEPETVTIDTAPQTQLSGFHRFWRGFLGN